MTRPLSGLVVVTGLPGSGKSSLARPLAGALGAALIAKDEIKERLFDHEGASDDDASRELGQRALSELFDAARSSELAVLDAFFWPGLAEPELASLARPMVQVHCACPVDLCERRYRARAVSGDRHAQHEPVERIAAIVARWRAVGSGRLVLDVPIREVDTTRAVNVAEIAQWVRGLLAR